MATDGEAAAWSASFLFNRCLTIAGGTSDIQRNVIAERLLGLPRGSLSPGQTSECAYRPIGPSGTFRAPELGRRVCRRRSSGGSVAPADARRRTRGGRVAGNRSTW